MAKSAKKPNKTRLHVVNNEDSAAVYRVSEAALKTAAKKHDVDLKTLSITYGDKPLAGDANLAAAEIVLSGGFDLSDIGTRAPHLKWLQSTSAGVEKYVPHIPPGVILTNASGVHAPKGGEYAMTALLMLNHRVPHFIASKEKKAWDQAFAGPIEGKTAVFLGVGDIGASAAKLAKRFGVTIIGVGRTARADKLFGKIHAQKDLGKVLPKADFLVCSTPLTSETRGLVSKAMLDLLPRHAGIVNLGRGPVIDNDALSAKLHAGELSGAVLDVFPVEPLPPESPLWTTPRLIMSPHCAVDDAQSYTPRALDIFFGNLKRYLSGRKLTNVVDTKLGY